MATNDPWAEFQDADTTTVDIWGEFAEATPTPEPNPFLSGAAEFGNAMAGSAGRFARGIVRPYYKATLPLSRKLEEMGLNRKGASAERQAIAEEESPGLAGRAGELLTDIALSAVPAARGAQAGAKLASGLGRVGRGVAAGAGAGTGSAAVHTAQDVLSGEGASPSSIGAEIGLSAVTGGVGSKAGSAMQNWSGERMFRILNPPRALQKGKSMNPVTPEKVNKVLQKTGSVSSIDEFASKTDDIVQDLAEHRDALIDAANIKIPVNQVVNRAKKEVERQVSEGRLRDSDAQRIYSELEKLKGDAKSVGGAIVTRGETFIPGNAARIIKTSSGKRTKFAPGEELHGRQEAEKAYYFAMKEQIDQTMKNRAPNLYREFVRSERELADVMPVFQAARGRAGAANAVTEAPWWIQIGAVTGTLGSVMSGNPGRAVMFATAPFIYAGSKGTRLPSRAATAGASLLRQSPGRDAASQAIRSASFGPEYERTQPLESARSAGGRAAALANAYNRATNEETKARILEQIERELQRNPQ